MARLLDIPICMNALTIGRRTYEVTSETTERGTIWFLKGKRGALYGTMRVHSKPEVMFLVHAARGFGIPAGMDRVRLTDRNGTLEVLSF